MIQIITDSMSDILQEDASKLGISVVPLSIHFEDKTYIDGVTITPQTFYPKMAVATALPKTSQVTPDAFYNAIKPFIDQGDEVLVITGSSLLSGTYQSALLAKDMLDNNQRIYLFDSMSAALGEAFFINEALRLRESKLSVQEIVTALEALRPRQKLFGSVADLKYLVMGGRLSSFGGKAGSILKIKPMLELAEGKLAMNSLVRGKKKMLEWFLQQLKDCPPDASYPIYFASANAAKALDEVRTFLEEHGAIFFNYKLVDIGPVIGTHVGPGTLAISWIGAEDA